MVSKREAFQEEYGINIPESEKIKCRICGEEKEHIFVDAKMHEWGYWVERRCKACGNQGIILHQ
jgi:uncharacterized Zn finger protein